MTTKPNFKFTVELKPTFGARSASSFPNDNCVGIKFVLKDKSINRYELRLFVQEAVAKKAQMTLGGLIMAQLSDCSNALRVLWTSGKNPDFQGYAMKPLGTWKNATERKKIDGTIQPFNAVISVPASKLNITKCKPIEVMQYADVLDARKGQFTLDISKLTIFSVSTQ